jgi:hypothetical protein
LKDNFLIDEKSDDEIMEENESDSFVLGYFSNWRAVCSKKLKAKVINLGRFGDFEAVRVFLDSHGIDFCSPADFELPFENSG